MSLPTAAVPPLPDAERRLQPAGRRVLVVDDDRDAAEVLAELLELEGSEVRVAHDGAEAIRLVDSWRPDVVLLDIGMPRLDGYEAARRIRRLPGGDRLILVALTGWGQADDRDRSAAAGFDHHLVKPVDLSTLTELLQPVA